MGDFLGILHLLSFIRQIWLCLLCPFGTFPRGGAPRLFLDGGLLVVGDQRGVILLDQQIVLALVLALLGGGDGLDVDLEAGQLGGQAGVLALLADGQGQLIVGHHHTAALAVAGSSSTLITSEGARAAAM